MTKLNLEPRALEKLRKLTCTQKGSAYHFLGYSLDLDTGEFRDLLTEDFQPTEWQIQILSALMLHYLTSSAKCLFGVNWSSIKDLPGGYAYERAFRSKSSTTYRTGFRRQPRRARESREMLIGGKRVNFGDASVEVHALEGVPITYILWAEGEFPASASVLFDESASCFLPTEDLAGLGEFTTSRLSTSLLDS